MFFETDNQTSQDLEFFNSNRITKSVFDVYSRTVTKGGQEVMRKLFKTPVTDPELLQCRRAEIKFFSTHEDHLHLETRSIDFIEHYFNIKTNPLHSYVIDAAYKGLLNKISPDGDYWIISNGIFYLIQLLLRFRNFIESTENTEMPLSLAADFQEAAKLYSGKLIKKTLDDPPGIQAELSYVQINSLDHFFRNSHLKQTRELLEIVYKIDVLQTLSRMVKTKGYSLPEYVTNNEVVLETSQAFHPLIDSPVANSFIFSGGTNLCFLTGPNMAGKSTFLKTIGILVYVAHLGFPVPAKELRISVFSGLYTTINLSDNLNFGYSHFYSEVRRVKEIVTKFNPDKKIVIIFDELFRGTNVKDAFEASASIISKLAKIKSNLFFISSHILEIADALESRDKILFRCFESHLVGKSPVYNYKLKEGISQERMGMVIIRDEKILDMIDQILEEQDA